jgi:hypothetical protein
MYNRSKLSELYTIQDQQVQNNIDSSSMNIVESSMNITESSSNITESSMNKKVVIMHKDKLKDPDVINYTNPDLIKDLANEYTRRLKETIDIRDLN